MAVNENRWTLLCKSLTIQPDKGEYRRLIMAYNEPHRAYHTQQHLWECLQQLDWAIASNLTVDSHIVEIALWYHDAIYQPRAKDNELKSAQWAKNFLTNAGVEPQLCEQVYSLIMTTCHHERSTNLLHQLMIDIDLSILGSQTSRFQEYEKQIRQEYAWVPWLIYKKKRVAVLNSFLRFTHIYNTELFQEKYEQKARHNIEQSISKLCS